MAHFRTDVESLRNSEPSHSGLTAIRSTIINKAESNPPVVTADEIIVSSNGHDDTNPLNNALRTLRSQPSLEQLTATLRSLGDSSSNGQWSLHNPGPTQAQVTNALLIDTVPSFWAVLSEQEKSLLTSCLRTVPGLSAVVARLRNLSVYQAGENSKSTELIPTYLSLCELLFGGDRVLLDVYEGVTASVTNPIKCEMAWREIVNLISSGKVVSTVAQAEDTAKTKSQCWLANATSYAAWLGRNIATITNTDCGFEKIIAAAAALSKALHLGSPNSLLSGYFKTLLKGPDGAYKTSCVLQRSFQKLPTHVKRTFTEHTLRWLSTLTLPLDPVEDDVAAIAACLSVLAQDPQIKTHLTAYFADPALSASISMSTRRAAVAVLAGVDDTDDLYSMLETLIATFSDTLFVAHAPNVQQDTLVQTALLLSGYLHRQKPVAFLVLGRSSNVMQSISNRLDSSNSRARWLGMILGTAVSQLVDKEGSRMNFGTDELTTQEAKRYLNLVKIQDRVGSVDDFASLLKQPSLQTPRKMAKVLPTAASTSNEVEKIALLHGKPLFGPPRPPIQTEIIGERVSEIFDEEDDEEEQLKPYAKPDSDPEDSDEDATLVNRQKVRPPVYIRDLMSMLRDDQNHDRFQSGIKHAASLIRRKANFGAEVKDHAEELCSILCHLSDPFETESFEELKIGALIAVLLADVKVIAPKLCQQAFSGDYSLAQRGIILSALGLGGRELAGFGDESRFNPLATEGTPFPTKRLPARLHGIYTPATTSTNRLDAASSDMERKLIQPIALQAADHSTADLDAVKVCKFSSRMDVERTKRKPAPNQLAKVFGESFFYPLIYRYQQEISAYGSASAYASSSFLLVTYLKTIALLLHASGASTLALPQITAEFWDLLLSLRAQAISDMATLQAVLFSLLTLLEVSSSRKQDIAHELPKQVMETQQWVDLVFERTGGGNLIDENKQDGEAKIRTLAAGVLVKVKEIIDAYQQQFIGFMS